jgi:hypothetical protein
MNISLQKPLVFTFLLLSLFFINSSTTAKGIEKPIKVKIKCHVELVGGKNIIHFGRIKTARIAKYPQWLIGQKIATDFSKQKQQVFKVKECVKSQHNFTSASSKRLDEDTVR